jgi:hypothetical protein
MRFHFCPKQDPVALKCTGSTGILVPATASASDPSLFDDCCAAVVLDLTAATVNIGNALSWRLKETMGESIKAELSRYTDLIVKSVQEVISQKPLSNPVEIIGEPDYDTSYWLAQDGIFYRPREGLTVIPYLDCPQSEIEEIWDPSRQSATVISAYWKVPPQPILRSSHTGDGPTSAVSGNIDQYSMDTGEIRPYNNR